MNQNTKQRFLSLDVMRGITIAGMILVNNPGTWESIYVPLRHVPWNGMTPTDLIFPFFIFAMGVAMSFSFKRYDYRLNGKLTRHIIKRSVLLFLIGLALNWLYPLVAAFMSPDGNLVDNVLSTFSNIRILGVLQRLALVYLIGSFIVLRVRSAHMWYVVVGILAAYTTILFAGDGFAFSSDNIIARCDEAILGVSHMYKDYAADGSRIAFDPEGLLSTLPAVAQVLIGYCCGRALIKGSYSSDALLKVACLGAGMLIVGFLFSYGCPLNKKIWSPTFTLVTCGLGALLLMLLTQLIDRQGINKWTQPFVVFGMNPLFIYVMAQVMSVFLVAVAFGDVSIKDYIYNALEMTVSSPKLASCMYAIMITVFSWMIGYILYLKRIYIKL